MFGKMSRNLKTYGNSMVGRKFSEVVVDDVNGNYSVDGILYDVTVIDSDSNLLYLRYERAYLTFVQDEFSRQEYCTDSVLMVPPESILLMEEWNDVD
jgi:hypothetical protein